MTRKRSAHRSNAGKWWLNSSACREYDFASVARTSTKVRGNIDKHIAYLEKRIRDMDPLVENSATLQAGNEIPQFEGVGSTIELASVFTHFDFTS